MSFYISIDGEWHVLRRVDLYGWVAWCAKRGSASSKVADREPEVVCVPCRKQQAMSNRK